MARQLFVYGTLMAPEVLQKLLQRVPRMTPAILHHHRLYSVKHATYPAILAKANESVKGLILWEMSQREMRILDDYEGTPQDESLFEYRQKEVEVEIEGSKEKVATICYIWVQPEERLTPGWSYDNWRNVYMKEFVPRISVPVLKD